MDEYHSADAGFRSHGVTLCQTDAQPFAPASAFGVLALAVVTAVVMVVMAVMVMDRLRGPDIFSKEFQNIFLQRMVRTTCISGRWLYHLHLPAVIMILASVILSFPSVILSRAKDLRIEPP